MATIGGKRRTKKQQRIKEQHVRAMTARLAGGGSTSRAPKIAGGKRFQQFIKNYRKAIESGELKPIKEIEDLIAKWGDVFNKDGTPSRTKLKSKKKREAFNKDMRDFNKKYKRWGKKAVKEIAEKQKEKRDKQAKTFGENQARKAVEEATKQGITEGIDFEQIAKEESGKYLKMLELFAMDSMNKLREELNLGSKVLKALASMGLDTETIRDYIDDFRNAYMNIPQEARDLAEQDDLEQAVIDLANLHGADNLTDVLTAYLEADSEAEQKEIAEAGEFHAQAVANGETTTSFSEFWSGAQGTMSKRWGEFL